MLYAIIAILVVIADQWIKLYVSTQGNIPAEGIQLIPGFLNLRYVENTGGPFGFLSGQNAAMWFVIAAGVFLLLVIIALATKFISGPTARWSIVLVAAGGVSIGRLFMAGYIPGAILAVALMIGSYIIRHHDLPGGVYLRHPLWQV